MVLDRLNASPTNGLKTRWDLQNWELLEIPLSCAYIMYKYWKMYLLEITLYKKGIWYKCGKMHPNAPTFITTPIIRYTGCSSCNVLCHKENGRSVALPLPMVDSVITSLYASRILSIFVSGDLINMTRWKGRSYLKRVIDAGMPWWALYWHCSFARQATISLLGEEGLQWIGVANPPTFRSLMRRECSLHKTVQCVAGFSM